MGCARLKLTERIKFTTKFGLRSMKSLRKTLFTAGVALLALSLVPLNARTPQPRTAPPRVPQQGSAKPAPAQNPPPPPRSEEHTSELQSPDHLVCRLLLEKKKIKTKRHGTAITSAHPSLHLR